MTDSSCPISLRRMAAMFTCLPSVPQVQCVDALFTECLHVVASLHQPAVAPPPASCYPLPSISCCPISHQLLPHLPLAVAPPPARCRPTSSQLLRHLPLAVTPHPTSCCPASSKMLPHLPLTVAPPSTSCCPTLHQLLPHLPPAVPSFVGHP